MAKKKSAKTDRTRQKAAQTALAKRAPIEGEVTLAAIAQLVSKKSAPLQRVRGVRVMPSTGEFGGSGTLNMYGKIMREDYNPLFDGKNALVIYDQMDRSDGQAGAAAEIIKQPIRAATWRVIPPEKATDNEKQIAEAAHLALFGEGIWPQGEGWDFTLRHLLMRVTFGCGLVEKIWMFDEDDGVLRWRRFGPRLPRSIEQFNVNPDGTLKEIVQYVPNAGTGQYAFKTIPADYLVLSVREREGDNYYGKSIYRRLYKHWWYKDDAYRIDGVRLDRYGVGIPVAKVAEGHSLDEEELNEVEQLLMSLRSHERAYIIEPSHITFRIMTPEGGKGGADGLMESVNHHDGMMVRGILATFMSDHAEGLNTNRTRTLADVFLHALKAEAKAVGNDLQSQAIRPFCNFNYDMSTNRYPSIEVTGIGDLTVEQLGLALAPLVQAGVVTADDSIEDILRKLFGLPPLPEGWKRGAKKPDIAAPVSSSAQGGAGGGAPNPPVDKSVAASLALSSAIDDLVTSFTRKPTEAQPIVINMPSRRGTTTFKHDPLTGLLEQTHHDDA